MLANTLSDGEEQGVNQMVIYSKSDGELWTGASLQYDLFKLYQIPKI